MRNSKIYTVYGGKYKRSLGSIMIAVLVAAGFFSSSYLSLESPANATHSLCGVAAFVAGPTITPVSVTATPLVTVASTSQTDINDAIAQLVTNGGGTLYFPAGTYTIDRVFNSRSALRFENNLQDVRIIGAGEGLTTLQLDSSYGYGTSLMYFIGIEEIEVADLTLIGQLSEVPQPANGIGQEQFAMNHAESAQIIATSNQAGIFIRDAENVYIHDVTFREFGGDGINMTDLRTAFVDNVDIDETGRNGITIGGEQSVEKAENVQIQNSRFGASIDTQQLDFELHGAALPYTFDPNTSANENLKLINNTFEYMLPVDTIDQDQYAVSLSELYQAEIRNNDIQGPVRIFWSDQVRFFDNTSITALRALQGLRAEVVNNTFDLEQVQRRNWLTPSDGGITVEASTAGSGGTPHLFVLRGNTINSTDVSNPIHLDTVTQAYIDDNTMNVTGETVTIYADTANFNEYGNGLAPTDKQLVSSTETNDAPGCNSAPTDISLSNATLQENNTPPTTIGTLTSTDANNTDTHTYSLVPGAGDTDNGSFSLTGTNNNTLSLTVSADYEAQTSYSVRIQTDDGNSGTYQEVLPITVTNDPGDDGNGPDITPPAIVLSGADPQTIVQGANYTELGATANDNVDGDITGDIVKDISNVNTAIIGNYSVTYNVSDQAGNNATTVTRTITVVAAPPVDSMPPTISSPVTNDLIEIEVGDTIDVDAIAITASDDTDGDITADIVRSGDTVPVDGSNSATVAGSYTLNYNVDDAAGNSATQYNLSIVVTTVADPDPEPEVDPDPEPEAGPVDTDGIDNAIEDAAPNNGDANNDGTLDSTQNNVASALNTNTTSDTTDYVTLEVDSSATIRKLVTTQESDLTAQDDSYDYPIGLFDFSFNTAVGATNTITLFLDKEYDTTGWEWRKFDGTTDNFAAVTSAVFASATVGTETVTTVSYAITDGGELDEDGIANGVIVDPAGPAVLASTDGDSSTLVNTGEAAGVTIAVGALLSIAAISTAWQSRKYTVFK